MATSTANQPDSPSYKCTAAQRQEESLTVVRDLAGGTPQMRKKGEVYLPKEAGESDQAYRVRLARSLLFNTFIKVREGLIGMALKPRKKPNPLPDANGETPDAEIDESNDGDIQLKEDVPPPLRAHIEDIDLNGNHLDVFAKDLFRDVINDGHAFILVDMQKPLTRSLATLSPEPTALDDEVTGRRPYWTKYKKDQARNWKSDRINGETVLTQITFKQVATESDGKYSEKEVVRYLVLRLQVLAEKMKDTPAVYGPMEWELFEERVENGKESEVPIDGNVTSLTRIPVVTIYARRKDFLESDPPLLDLAYLNIGHWQQWSDLNCQLRMLVPILIIKGELVGTESQEQGVLKPKIAIGPGAALQFRDDKGDAGYTSHDGAAIEATRQSLMDLEQRMSAVGLSIIAAKGDREITATEKAMDQDERTSELASWLRALKDGIESAFEIHAVDYLNLPTGGSIILGFDEPDPQAVMAIDAPKGGIPGQQMPPQNAGMVQ